MKKDSIAKSDDEMRPEYDLSQLKGGVRGKYYPRAIAGTNLLLIDPDLAKMFPDSAAVNRTLRAPFNRFNFDAGGENLLPKRRLTPHK